MFEISYACSRFNPFWLMNGLCDRCYIFWK
ncbi:hypothetical protein F383_09093 [Gossypium arboreum]|uniref:Uncharacterized protein n=1 Tax=Gossypium arboreum TaxID=29729 RepID=A0A0B0NXE5_GOSAR|nr:hypothetical protein F383_09093 [Gossypium arboreum]